MRCLLSLLIARIASVSISACGSPIGFSLSWRFLSLVICAACQLLSTTHGNIFARNQESEEKSIVFGMLSARSEDDDRLTFCSTGIFLFNCHNRGKGLTSK